MLCPRCYGKHVVLLNASWVPCPECAGVGELHCCDGLREQGECDYVPSAHAETRATPAPSTLSLPPAGVTTRLYSLSRFVVQRSLTDLPPYQSSE